MNQMSFENFSVIIKTEDGLTELLNTTVYESLKNQNVITVRYTGGMFADISRVIIVLYKEQEAYRYKGTVRPIRYGSGIVEIALYHGEEVKNRKQRRYKAKTEINVIRRVDKGGTILDAQPTGAELIDISNGGVGFECKSGEYKVGDSCSITLINKAITRILYAKIVRVGYTKDSKFKYGCVLLDDREAARYKLI